MDTQVFHELASDSVARACLKALVALSARRHTNIFHVGDISDEVEKGDDVFLGNLVYFTLEVLAVKGFVRALGRDQYAISDQGEVANVLLAYERHALA